jgi:hypothetical protein
VASTVITGAGALVIGVRRGSGGVGVVGLIVLMLRCTDRPDARSD